MNNPQEKKINSTGLWLVRFDCRNYAEVIRIVEGKIGQDKNDQLLTCRDAGDPNLGVIPFWVTEKHLKNVYRKIKEPLIIENR